MREAKKEIFNEIWFYYKKWINHKGTESEWDAIIEEGNILAEKYNQDKFARSLILAIHEELARE
jgi:hypothetical protein